MREGEREHSMNPGKHRTSNIQHPTPNLQSRPNGKSLDVRCWVLDVSSSPGAQFAKFLFGKFSPCPLPRLGRGWPKAGRGGSTPVHGSNARPQGREGSLHEPTDSGKGGVAIGDNRKKKKQTNQRPPPPPPLAFAPGRKPALPPHPQKQKENSPEPRFTETEVGRTGRPSSRQSPSTPPANDRPGALPGWWPEPT
jgi:hypothetical protein